METLGEMPKNCPHCAQHGREHAPNPAEPWHTCPFAEEINDDYESLCCCCSKCEQECADDI